MFSNSILQQKIKRNIIFGSEGECQEDVSKIRLFLSDWVIAIINDVEWCDGSVQWPTKDRYPA